jgi:hypothetical protein
MSRSPKRKAKAAAKVATQAADPWAKPKPVTGLDMVFGVNAVKEFMPPMASIPDIVEGWRRFQMEWFYGGLKDAKVTPKPGIDKGEALAHLKSIQSSFEPKHEHKVAAVAYLASRWFERAEWTGADGQKCSAP